MDEGKFDWLEYIAFVLMLFLSTMIGIYFGFIEKSGKKSLAGYMFGGKSMNPIPVCASIICSYISGLTFLGVPSETYSYGAQYMNLVLCFVLSALVISFIFLPVFYNLQVPSIYEYLEMRFDSTVRRVASVVHLIYQVLFTTLVIYGPALSLHQVSGISVHVTAVSVAVICIFYTTIGGLKAVCWTDLLQGLMMIISVLVIAVIGTSRVGGLFAVIEAAKQSDRLNLFDMDLDPRRRTTFWTANIGLMFIHLGVVGLSPCALQKFMAVPTLKTAQWVTLFWAFGQFFFIFTSGYFGLVAYQKYKDCDPVRSEKISRLDQILPFFIMDTLGDLRGLPGIFVAGIFSAALSSMSSSINIVSVTVYSDLLGPFIGPTSDIRAKTYMKIIAVVFGTTCVLLVMVVEKLGAILEVGNIAIGSTTGCVLGVFMLGMFVPQTNIKGASIGVVSGMILMFWTAIGNYISLKSKDLVYSVKPTSVAACPQNTTINFREPLIESSGNVFPLYELSFLYYSVLGCTSVVVVGCIVSYITGPNKPENVKRELLSPLIHRFLPTPPEIITREMETLVPNCVK